MKVGVVLPGAARPHEIKDLAARAEEAGADSVWILDVRREPYIASAAALDATSRILVGTDVAVAFARSPAVTAQAAWDLSMWGRGRFILGLGSQVGGTLEARFSVEADHPAPRMRDYVNAVKSCFESYRRGHGRYEGRFYNVRMPVFQPGEEPDVQQPEIYVAGVNPLMISIAGEVGDGLAVHPFNTRAYMKEVVRPALQAGADKAGRAAPIIFQPLVVSPDRSYAVKQMAVYSVPGYRRVLDHAGLGDVADRIFAAQKSGQKSEARALVDEHVVDRVGVLKGEDLAAEIAPWAELADRIALSVPWFGLPHEQQMQAARDLIEKIRALPS